MPASATKYDKISDNTIVMEREIQTEKLHPNQVLNDALNYYIFKAVEDGVFQKEGNVRAELGIIEHLAQSNAYKDFSENRPKKEVFEEAKNTVIGLGNCALEAINSGRDVKDLAKGRFDPRLIAYASQALLFVSYLPLLENLKAVVLGEVEYGYGKHLNRLQPHNSIAAGEMMKPASKRIAERVAVMAEGHNVKDLAVLELGCGNASFSAALLEAFEAKGLPAPVVLATDLDPATQKSAQKLFEEKGISDHLNLMKVDMGDPHDLMAAAQKLNGNSVLVHIGYILHENRDLAVNTLNALSQVFFEKNVIFAFSEYYRQDQIIPDIPLWFQTIHAITQDLFERDEFMEFVSQFGFLKIDEVVHNTRRDSGEVINSTTFWEGRGETISFQSLHMSVDAHI